MQGMRDPHKPMLFNQRCEQSSQRSRLINREQSNADGLPLLYDVARPHWWPYRDGRRQAPLRRPASLLSRTRCPERGLSGWQLRHEGVPIAVEGGVEGARGGGVVGGGRVPSHVGPALSHGDAKALIEIRPPEEGGVIEPRVDDQRVARVVCTHRKPVAAIPLQLVATLHGYALAPDQLSAGSSPVLRPSELPERSAPRVLHRSQPRAPRLRGSPAARLLPMRRA
jgi:hypothetical protein